MEGKVKDHKQKTTKSIKNNSLKQKRKISKLNQLR